MESRLKKDLSVMTLTSSKLLNVNVLTSNSVLKTSNSEFYVFDNELPKVCIC